MFRPEGQRGRNLIDILPAIGAAAVTLIRSLEDARALPIARLACKDLRTFIDDNVNKLTFSVAPDDWDRWAAGQLPSLERWPRCSNVHVELYPNQDDEEGEEDMAALSALPFLGLSPDVRQRVTKLSLKTQGEGAALTEHDVSHLAVLLPNLQELDLQRAYGMSYEPQAQQLMYDSLASLQGLRSLALPSDLAMNRIHTLARSSHLTNLVIGATFQDEQSPSAGLEGQAVAALAKLQHLRALRIDLDSWIGVCEDGTVSLLLNSLPAALESLRIQTSRYRRLTLSLLTGCVHTVALEAVIPDDAHAGLLRTLLGCRALAPQLARVAVQTVCWTHDGKRMDSPELSPFWDLLRRSARVEIAGVVVGSVADAAPALRKVGAVRIIKLAVPSAFTSLQLWLRGSAGLSAAPATAAATPGASSPLAQVEGPGGALAAGAVIAGAEHGNEPAPLAASNAAMEAPSTPPLPHLPSAPELGRALLYRLVSGAPAGAEAPPGWELPTAAPAAADDAPRASPSSRLLLLSGPMIAGLAHAPDLLIAWVRWLNERAAAAGGGEAAAAGGGGAPHVRRIAGFQVLPAAIGCPGLLVRCGDAPGAVAAVAAAAGAVAAGQGAAGALTVALISWRPEPTAFDSCSATSSILSILRQELQALWDRCVGQCGGVAEAELELLQAVMRLWVEVTKDLGDLPEDVPL